MPYAVITISSPGADVIGPFNLYSDVDGYTSAFESNITLAQLLVGFASNNLPVGTTQVRVQAVDGVCNNSVNASSIPLEFYFTYAAFYNYAADFASTGTYAYVYGGPTGYYNGTSLVPSDYIYKINADLTHDAVFDAGSGFNAFPYDGCAIYVQPDGKVIITGAFTQYNGVTANSIIRLNQDGTIDGTFNSGTGFNNFTLNIMSDSSGNLFVLGLYSEYDGYTSPRLVKMLSDGSKDTSFNVGTGFNNTTTGGLVNSDDSMIITGYFNSYNGTSTAQGITIIESDGTINGTFDGGTGFNTGVGQPNYLARILGEDSFYVAGYFTTYKGVTQNRIVKLDLNGDVDVSFDAGTGFNNLVYNIKMVWSNKLLVWGEFTDYNGTTSQKLIILNADGTVHQAFAANTYTITYVIGNNLYGTEDAGDGANKVIYTYIP